jgi:lipopolysaccharide transport system permease protein
MNDKEAGQVLVIEAGRTAGNYWKDLWRYRELLYFLARRDATVRYKQTLMGVAWIVMRPIVTMLVFTLVFGRLAQLPSEGVPYSLLVLSALVPWYFFSAAVSEGSASLIANSSLLSKVYFPRLIVPLSTVAVAFIDLAVNIALFLLLLTWFGYGLTLRVLTLPAFILLALAGAFGIGLWFSAINVRYRDVQHAVPFLLQFGLFISPIAYASSVIPELWRPLYVLNPLVGVIEGFRWALLGGRFELRADALLSATAVAAVLLATGIWFFRRTERTFADII